MRWRLCLTEECSRSKKPRMVCRSTTLCEASAIAGVKADIRLRGDIRVFTLGRFKAQTNFFLYRRRWRASPRATRCWLRWRGELRGYRSCSPGHRPAASSAAGRCFALTTAHAESGRRCRRRDGLNSTPSLTSIASASRRELRETPSWAASWRSAGSRMPASSCCSSISARTRRATSSAEAFRHHYHGIIRG